MEEAPCTEEVKRRAIIKIRGTMKRAFERVGRVSDAKISKQDLNIADEGDVRVPLQELHLPVGFHPRHRAFLLA